MATCIAIRIAGDICGRETEDSSDYCFIHRDLDWLRGLKDIRDYIGGGVKFLGYAKTALGILVIFSNVLAQHSTMPMAQSALAQLGELKTDTQTLIADLEVQKGRQHTQEEAHAVQARLSAIVDRLEGIRTQVDEIVPSPAASRLEPFDMA
jgi:hypothetical protein